MQRAVEVKQEDSKMSVCSDFVEHIWKPGSCKNCFCPRQFHHLQSPPLDLVSSSGFLQDLNGIRAKAEPTTLEEDGVISLPYSKPTIAVKPTMINSDVANTQADGNLNTDIPQTTKRTPSKKHVLMKPGGEQQARFDSFGNNVMWKPLSQSSPSDCTSHCPQSPSFSSSSDLEKTSDKKIPIHSVTLLSNVDTQEEGSEVSSKEKLAYLGIYHNSSMCRERYVGSSMDSEEASSIHQREQAPVSETASTFSSPDLEMEGGEYCSITDCCVEASVPHSFDSTKAKMVSFGNKKPIATFQQEDAAVNARTRSRVVNFSEGQNKVWNSYSGFQREKHPAHDYVYNHLCSETDSLTFPSDIVLKNSNTVGLPQGSHCYTLVKEPEQTDVKYGEDISNTAEQQLSHEVGAPNEPIYAESTKRKKTHVSHPNTPTKSDFIAYSPTKEQQDGLWKEKTFPLSCEKEFQDSTGQVTTITIMAAHTEDDNRTIFLSSPDSAVGFQWPCVSPTSNLETGKMPSSFEHSELQQLNSELNSREDHPDLQTQPANRGMMDETPAIPPKLSKGSPPMSERSSPQSITSSMAEDLDSKYPANVVPKNNSENTNLDLSSSVDCHNNRNSSEESSRSPASLGSERRQKYFNLSWSKQCRIEEEEEEEHRFLESTSEVDTENGTNNSCHQEEKGSVQESRPGGMSKSASFAFEFPRDRSGTEEFVPPPPPPPKKQSRHFLKMNRSHSELEKLNSDSAENLSSSFQGIHVTFTTGSTDSLNLDTNMFSSGGQLCKTSLHSPTHTGKQIFPSSHIPVCSSKDRPHLQPPPLPQKKTVSRAVSSPDGFYWGPASPARAAIPTSPKLNFSQSESNVCIREELPFGCNLGINHRTFSSSESLEKTFRPSRSPFPCCTKSNHPCYNQIKNLPSHSSSQQNMSSQLSSGSTLQLHNLLSNIDNKEGMYAKLGGLYAESLRRLVSKCEDCFMRDQKSELHFSENNWSLFKLTCNKPCCDSGDAIYYCATCSKDPSSTYAVKICKSQDTKAVTSCCTPSVPVHFNIQQDCGHFVASVPSSMLKNASVAGQGSSRATTELDCVVVITREVPHQTAADFVKDAVAYHKTHPELYERRVCFLLLQLCNGLEHLKEYSVIHRDLCLENLLLVHCKSPTCSKTRDNKHLPRLIISNFLKAKQKSGTMESKVKKNQARLAPEIVSATQYKKFDEFQTGILIYELLHQPNPFEVKAHLREQEYSQDDLPLLPSLSIYSRGLQQLAHLLLEADPIKRIRITEAKRILQCLLWGPRKDLTDQPLNHEEALHQALHNWVDMKRALLMMKFAERAVDAERSVELEDWLCCQYLASAEPASLSKSLKLLQLL